MRWGMVPPLKNFNFFNIIIIIIFQNLIASLATRILWTYVVKKMCISVS